MSENNYNLDLYKFPTPELRFDVEVTPEGLQEALNIDLQFFTIMQIRRSWQNTIKKS